VSSIDNPAITVGEMKMHGVAKVWALCDSCGNGWQVPIDFLPPATNLRKIAELLICPVCGDKDVKASPTLPGSD
jgi:hypothetical protein